jgi:hypothetical protein
MSFSAPAQAKLMTTLNASVLMAMSVRKALVFTFVLRQAIVRAKACPPIRQWFLALSAFRL